MLHYAMNRVRLAGFILIITSLLKIGLKYHMAPMADVMSPSSLQAGTDVNNIEYLLYAALLLFSFLLFTNSNAARIVVLFWLALYIIAQPLFYALSAIDPLMAAECDLCTAYYNPAADSMGSILFAVARLVLFIFSFILLWGRDVGEYMRSHRER